MKVVTSLLLAFCISTVWATVPAAALGGRLSPGVAWVALLAGLVGAVIYWVTGQESKPMKMGAADALPACGHWAR